MFTSHTVRYIMDMFCPNIKDNIKDRCMENKKDNDKGHNEQSIGKTAYSAVFGNNHFHAFIFKKTEKLVSALYLVTSFVPENEPIRITLRGKSLCLLSDTMSLRTLSHKMLPSAISTVVATILEIIALLEIGRDSGYVSEMNVSVLKEEYLTLGAMLKRKGAGIVPQGVEITEEMLAVPDMYLAQLYSNNTYGRQSSQKRITQTQKSRTAAAKGTVSEHGAQDRHSDRKQHILKLIKTRGAVSVKEVATVVLDCSEKTLQRELLSLVKVGILKKKGEKRWSTYSLV